MTGARSGIGRATCDLLRERGERVVGIDRSDCEIDADLSTPRGRDLAVAAVGQLCPAGIDSLIECAGLSSGDGATIVSVNYFAAVTLASALRPLLAVATAPRVVIVSSSAALLPVDDALVTACLDGHEAQARALAAADVADDPGARLGLIYGASKRALTRWIRRTATRAEWAGAGILLNGIAPGLVRTQMTLPLLATKEGRAVLAKAVPRAVAEAADPEDIALLLAFLAGPDNRYLVGQVPYIDGGTDVILRGDAVI